MTAYLESPAGLMIPPSRNGHLTEVDRAYALTIDLLESRLGRLEQELQEAGWTRLTGENGKEFSREALANIIDLSRVMYIKNPLINRAVEVGALYVFGQDLSVKTADPKVKEVVARFDEDNAATLTGQQASRLLDVEQRVTGNVFLALFTDQITGRVLVRPIPVEEMQKIVTNPEDRYQPWYYLREWQEQPVNGGPAVTRKAYYPDIDYVPATKPDTLEALTGDGIEIRWDSPVKHVKTGAFLHWRWGVPEVYAALDWARAYKEQLEDDATRSRALARYAYRITTDGGRGAVEAAKARLNTTLGAGNGRETNPAPAAGSTFIGDKSVGLDPIRIAGSTLDPGHSRPARLMAAAALGLPDTILSGDVDQGTLATAKSLDRPTELGYAEDREAWKEVRSRLYRYAIDADLAATRGILPKALTDEQRKIDLSWPDLLESDVVARVQAVAVAAPYLSPELTSRLMMAAIGVEDIDGELQKRKEQPTAPVPPEPVTPTEAKRKASKHVDLDAALAFFDKVAPNEFAGMIDAEPVGGSS